MLKLKKSLTDSSGNELTKLFAIELKTLVRRGLDIVSRLVPEIEEDEYEWPNSRILLQLRNDFLAHENHSVRLKEFKAIFDFVIMLYDSDEYYHQRIDWLIQEIKARPFREGAEPDPRWWNTTAGRRVVNIEDALDLVRTHVDGSPESLEGLGKLDILLR